MSGSEKSRRDLLLGKPTRTPDQPSTAATLRLSIHAMACEFGAAVNLGETQQLLNCGDALEVVPEIESWLSIYQSDSELTRLNASAGSADVPVSAELFDLLNHAAELHRETWGAFDMASGAQIRLWQRCRTERRIPTDDEVRDAVASSGMHRVELRAEQRQVRFLQNGLRLDAGAIGKGYALDQVARRIEDSAHGARDFLIHGGRSSVLARGEHNNLSGWPVGIGNPLLTKRRLGTVILRNQAMSTSGSNIQFFRYEGRRFGHILDPRSGWPVEGMVSVTVIAESAAVADAVSTAFFVLGVEKAAECCDNLSGVGAILVPFPGTDARVRPVVLGIPPEQLFWDEGLVALQ